MTALTEQEFRVKSDEALEQARRALLPLADQEGFEIELQDGTLNLLFEEPSEARFVVSPNAPVRQIWVSAMARGYKLAGRPSSTPSRSTPRRCRSFSIASRGSSAASRRGVGSVQTRRLRLTTTPGTPAKTESVLQRIGVVDQERVLAGDPGRACNLRHDRRIVADHRPAGHAARRTACRSGSRARTAVVAEQPHGVETAMTAAVPVPHGDRSTSRVGKDRDVSQVGAVVVRRAGEDRAVDAAAGPARADARSCARLRSRRLIVHAGAAQLGQMRGVQRQADRFAVDDRVERAAERDIGAKLPRAELHGEAAVQHERRHVDERHALDADRVIVLACLPVCPPAPPAAIVARARIVPAGVS